MSTKKKDNKKGLYSKSQDIINNFNFFKYCHDLHEEHKTSWCWMQCCPSNSSFFRRNYSYRIKRSCGYANSRKSQLIDVNIDMILCDGLHLMQEAINDCITIERTCFNKKKITSLTEYGPHLIIDTSMTILVIRTEITSLLTNWVRLKKSWRSVKKTYILIDLVDYSTEKKPCHICISSWILVQI